MRRLLVVLLFALSLFAPSVHASNDDDRESAGMEKLGIQSTFGRWPDGIVTWQYNPADKPAFYADDAAFVALLEQAMLEIENAAGVDFQYQGISAATVVDYNDLVVTVGWDALGGAAGVAGPSSSNSRLTELGYWHYKDGALRFSISVNWDRGDTEASDELLIQVATHELLHLLGIGHSDVPDSIMYSNPYTNLTHLRADDIDALQSMYGPSSTPASPQPYLPPADNSGNLVRNSYLSDNENFQAPVSTVIDTETAFWLGITWEEAQGAHNPVEFRLIDPSGFMYVKRVDAETCSAAPPSYCIFWYSLVEMDTLRTLPGEWKVHVVLDNDLEVTHILDNQFTAPVINQAPTATLDFSTTAGPSPLTVDMDLTIDPDNEGDIVSASWHIPTVGETAFTPNTSAGQDSQQVTFTQDGEYEIYVTVNDDWTRYGSSGSAAGDGFRQLFRQVISVGPLPEPEPFTGIVSLGDLNGNGSPDLGVAVAGGTRVHIRDGATDALITDIDFGEDMAFDMAVLPDLNGSGDPEIAILQQQASGQVRAQARDTVTGAVTKNLWYGLQYEPVSMGVVADYSGNGLPEVAVLGSEAGTDAVRVQIQDTATGFLDNVFLGTQSIAKDLVSVADTSGNGVPEMGILGVLKTNDQVRMQMWDADTAAFQSNVWFAKVYQPQSTITMPDINSNGSDEIVAMGVDPATQNIRVQVRDSDSLATHYNIWLGAVNEAVDIALINDINSDGVSDLAVLLKTPGGTGRVRVQSGLNGAFIRNLFFSAVENPVGLTVMPDYSGNGFDELAVLGENAGTRHVQILDTASGTQVNRISFP